MASHLLPLSSPIPSSPMSPDDDEEEDEEEEPKKEESPTHHTKKSSSSSRSSTSSITTTTPQPHRIIIQKSTKSKSKSHRQRNSKKLMSITMKNTNSTSSSSEDETTGPIPLHRRKSNRIIKNENYNPVEFNNNNNNNYDEQKARRPAFKKWNEHGENIEYALNNYLTNEMFVDVTIILRKEEHLQTHSTKSLPPTNEIKAHKIILAYFSDYFSKLLVENPCKHPVLMLQDFERWEIESIIGFMYNGTLRLANEEQLEMLLKTAEALQIRGLGDCIQKSAEWNRRKMKPISRDGLDLEAAEDISTKSIHNQKRRKSTSPKFYNDDLLSGDDEDDETYGPTSPELLNLSMQIGGKKRNGNNYVDDDDDLVQNGPKPQTTVIMTGGGGGLKIGDFNPRIPGMDSSISFPRRKQARPRRRSGDFVAQDLRVITPGSDQRLDYSDVEDGGGDGDEMSVSLEKDLNNHVLDFTINRNQHGGGRTENYHGAASFQIPSFWKKNENSPKRSDDEEQESIPSPSIPSYRKSVTPDSIYGLEREKGRAAIKRSHRNDPQHPQQQLANINPFKLSPSSPSSFLLNLTNGHPLSSLSGHYSDTESNPHSETQTPPTVFSPHHHGFPLQLPTDNRGNSNNSSGSPNSGVGQGQQQPQLPPPNWPGLQLGTGPLFGRHRAQHSAPRGGPPRAWSNTDLTEALHNVWNKKMTTSQASRIFGIPYNSLLMYVRGKYGKSLKLDLLKKGLDLAMEKSNSTKNNANNNNNNPSPRTSPTTTTNSNNNNNNNNIINRKTQPTNQSTSGNKSKSGGSPMSSLNLSSLMGASGGTGNNNKISDQQHYHHHPPPHLQSLLHHSDQSQAQIPGGFNPFAAAAAAAVAGSIFGDFSGGGGGGPSPGHYGFPGAGAFLPPPPGLMLNEKSSSASNSRRQQQL